MPFLLMSALALGLTGPPAPDRALPEVEVSAFRERLQQLRGQPMQVLVDELGPGEAGTRNGRRSYGWGYQMVYSDRPAEACLVNVTVDAMERIVTAEMNGGDLTCSLVLGDLRETEARYRATPGLREREAAERARLLERLTGLRRSLSNTPPR